MPRYSFMRRTGVAIAAGLLLAACSAPGAASHSPISLAPCTGLTLASTPQHPQPPGTTVTFTATVNSCPSPVYRFWVIDLFGVGNIAQDWSSSASYAWSTRVGASSGTYALSVEARDKSDPNIEATKTMLYILGCAVLAVDPSPPSPQLPGTSVVFNVKVNSCPSPLYQFRVIDPNGVGLLEQSWSDAASFSWKTTSGMQLGTYMIRAEVRSADDRNIEQVYTVSYTLGLP